MLLGPSIRCQKLQSSNHEALDSENDQDTADFQIAREPTIA